MEVPPGGNAGFVPAICGASSDKPTNVHCHPSKVQYGHQLISSVTVWESSLDFDSLVKATEYILKFMEKKLLC